MTADTIGVLKITCWIVAASSGILAAWFEFRDRAQTEEERRATRERYGEIWQTIEELGFSQLPEKVILWIFKVKHRIILSIMHHFDIAMVSRRLVNISVITMSVVIGLSCFSCGWNRRVLWPLIILCVLDWGLNYFRIRIPNILDRLLLVVLGFFVLHAFAAVVIELLDLTLLYALLAMICLVPLSLIILTLGLECLASLFFSDPFREIVKDRPERDTPQLLAYAISLSFSITLLSLVVGHLAIADAWIPKTFQMLVSNVICDAITLVATFMILGLAVNSKRISISTAILLDLLVAALLACASLWFGLSGTPKALSMKEVIFVLFGRSLDAAHFELGPFFWVMHTTFLPTLCYLGIIAMWWIAKLVILPCAKILYKGQEVEKPHRLPAGAFLFVAVVFGAFSKGLDLLGSGQ